MGSPPPQPSEQYRNWLDLPLEVTESILKKLGVIEILTGAQKVGLLWRYICKDPSMWLALNMDDNLDSWDMSYDLKKICRHAVDLSCGRLVGIEVGEFCDENLLQYITERSRGLRYLRAISWRLISISDKGWSEIAANIPLLEELELSYYNCSWSNEKVLEVVGRCCPHLKSLKLKCAVYWPRKPSKECNLSAVAIAENMPGLLSLLLVGSKLSDDGVQTILEGCPRLQSLELRYCRYVTMEGALLRRCSERIKDFRFNCNLFL